MSQSGKIESSKPAVSFNISAERNEHGDEYLESQQWQRMGTQTFSSKATEYFDKMTRKITGDLQGEDLMRVGWLSATLFFIVGGYWLLRSLKDPIMSVINGVEYIPQAKIASLFVVFGLVIVCKCRSEALYSCMLIILYDCR